MKPFTSPWQSSLFVQMVRLARLLLRPLGNLENRFIAGLVDQQNRRVKRHFQNRGVGTVLLIMPRCVKLTGCRAQVQTSLNECLGCTGCPLGDVARVCADYDLSAVVAFRSHIAFDIARRRHPDLIIATACHDRLVKALRSVPGIPALLAPLSGMERMCINATVDMDWLRTELAAVTGLSPTASPAPAPGRPIICPVGDKT